MSKVYNMLFPYQRKDVEFMLSRRRCINGNPMGAGKTIEALAVLETLQPSRALVICKNSYLIEWWRQIEELLGVECDIPTNIPGDKLGSIDLVNTQYLCINYELLAIKDYLYQLLKVNWDVAVFDEAHMIRNPEAKRTKNAFLLSSRIDRLYPLTGTPIQNSPADLYPLFRLIDPRNYHNYNSWKKKYCVFESNNVYIKGHKRTFRKIKPGAINNADELNLLLHVNMCRHERTEIMPSLPPKLRRTVYVDLGSESVQYSQMEKEYFAILNSGLKVTSKIAGAKMMRLRQICLEPNLLGPEEGRTLTPTNTTRALLDIIEDTDEKVLVFSFFEQYIRLLCEYMDQKGIPYVSITGKKKPTENSLSETLFQTMPEVKVCAGTIDSMGECWTLTEAGIIIFTDIAWNPATNDQCESRSYGRVNKGLMQNESRLIIDIITRNTIEEHVHKVVRDKEAMIGSIMNRRCDDKIIDSLRKSRDWACQEGEAEEE